MILTDVGYFEFKDRPDTWSLCDFSLGNINLFVGKNSTGKTRINNIISGLAEFASGVRQANFDSANYDFKYSDGSSLYQYILNISGQEVEHEKFIENGTLRLERERDGMCCIFFEKEDNYITIKIPDKRQIAVFSRRDTIQHPFLEKIFSWASELIFYKFASSLGREVAIDLNIAQSLSLQSVNLRDTQIPVTLFVLGEKIFSTEFKTKVIFYMREIGFNINDVSIYPDRYSRFKSHNGTSILLLHITEDGIKAPISQQDMSQGMFRSLSLLIQITFNILNKTVSTVIIDDIGEGLDFDRSTKLIKLLMNMAKTNNIQLIMSTNDRFVMNAVPLEYWQVIQRKGSQCRVFNYKNSKEKFDEFEYTGLNNFDFLATDYINSEWEKT
jgi:energy-coupling factor transporter ATP-binding protein EcfA2